MSESDGSTKPIIAHTATEYLFGPNNHRDPHRFVQNDGGDNVTDRIAAVNKTLSEMGSVFRVDEDLVMLGCFGNMTFLRRYFPTIEDLEEYVNRCRAAQKNMKS